MQGFPVMPEHQTAPTFDLQSHSTYSDGALPPAEVVKLARDAGVQVLALTDHDTVDGVTEALSAAGDIRIVPAVELSSVHGEHEDLHILGYGLDHTDADAARHARRTSARTASAGSSPWPRNCERSASPSTPPGSSTSRREARTWPAALLEDNDLNLTKNEVFAAATSSPARRPTSGARGPRSSRRSRSSTPPAASPSGRTRTGTSSRREGALREFAADGIDGVEAFYITHTEEQTRHLHALARELGLITTGSADFHGPAHDHFNRFRAFHLYGLEPDLGRLLEA